MRYKLHQPMTSLSMLEWNSSLYQLLRNSYAAVLRNSYSFNDGIAIPAAFDESIALVVDSHSQTLFCCRRGNLLSTYGISTSSNGIGCGQDTGCTPHGWHRIAEKIGEDEPPGTIFKGRIAGGVAQSLSSFDDDDLITSRIMWLSGLQPGLNNGGRVDSYSRYIYIHGTAQEHLIGKPVSHGCIRMHNADVIELFDMVDNGAIVFISSHLKKEFELPEIIP